MTSRGKRKPRYGFDEIVMPRRLPRTGTRRQADNAPLRTSKLGSATDSERSTLGPISSGSRKRGPGYFMGLPISFPFERDKLYPIGELRAFQTQLSQTRRKDPVLSANIRAGKLPWAKLCCEEYFRSCYLLITTGCQTTPSSASSPEETRSMSNSVGQAKLHGFRSQ